MKIVFTDLDGTLLDHDTYSYECSLPGIELLKRNDIPLILVSSKTFYEMEKLSLKLKSSYPFIFENGSGVAFYNENQFSPVILGQPVNELIDVFQKISGFFPGKTLHLLEMEVKAVQEVTGLSLERSKLARERLASLPFLIQGEKQLNQAEIIKLNKKIKKYNASITKGGRFYHLIAKSVSKGKAIQYLMKRYQKEMSADNFLSMGIGDSLNDLSMLKEVDFPFLVRIKDKSYLKTDFKVTVTDNIGPKGFTEAVEIFIDK